MVHYTVKWAVFVFISLTSADVLYVNLGDHDLQSNSETRNKLIKASKITQHAQYNNKTQDNDISLLKLETPLVFDKTVSLYN